MEPPRLSCDSACAIIPTLPFTPLQHHNDEQQQQQRLYRRPHLSSYRRRSSLERPSDREPRKRARLGPRTRSASMSPPRTNMSLSDRAPGNTIAGVEDKDGGDGGASSMRLPRAPLGSHSNSDIFETITHPGAVRINVQGAFIVDEEEGPSTPRSEDYEHDPRDIRLPNHTAVVSHIAVDVSVHARHFPQNFFKQILIHIRIF